MEKTMRVTGKGKLSVKPDMIRLLLDTTKVCSTYEEALHWSSEQTEELKKEYRQRRETECFSVINKGQLWYEGITI